MKDARHEPAANLTDVTLQGYQAIFETYVDANRRAFAYGQSLFAMMTRPYASVLEAMTRSGVTTAPSPTNASPASGTAPGNGPQEDDAAPAPSKPPTFDESPAHAISARFGFGAEHALNAAHASSDATARETVPHLGDGALEPVARNGPVADGTDAMDGAVKTLVAEAEARAGSSETGHGNGVADSAGTERSAAKPNDPEPSAGPPRKRHKKRAR